METVSPRLYCYSRTATWKWLRFVDDYSINSVNYHWAIATNNASSNKVNDITYIPPEPLQTIRPLHGWSRVVIPGLNCILNIN